MSCYAVKWCGNNSKTCSVTTNNITFHRFPRDPDMKNKWINVTKRENWFPSKYSIMCSKHFTEDCFLKTKNKRRLMSSALPTLFLPRTMDTPNEVASNVLQENAAEVSSKSLEEIQPAGLTTPKSYKRKETPSQFNSPVKKRLCRHILEMSEKINHKNKQLKNLREKNRYLKKRVASLKTIIKELESKNLVTTENANILNQISVCNKELVKRQIMTKKSGHVLRKKYSPELRSFAMTLAFYSAKAYKYVRTTFATCLPSLRTLSKWYQTIEGKPGFTKESFIALKRRAEMNSTNFIATLVFDEIKIKSKVEFVPSNQRTFGYVDFGGDLDSDCNNLCTEALVLLVVPINGCFKVPIGYFLVDKTNAEQKEYIVLQAIELCHDSNITIKALTFDGCPVNVAMAKRLGCNLTADKMKTSFKHPVTGADVFVFLDPVHMLKLVRNAFEQYREFKDENGNSLKWEFIQHLQEMQDKEHFHLANKLRAKHIHFKTDIMKVKLASQLFSRSVATALNFCEMSLRLPEFQGVKATARMVQLINDLFDILDSKVHGYGYKRALNKDNHVKLFEKLDECKQFLLSASTNIRSRNQTKTVKLIDSPRFTGFIGFCVAIESTKGMFQDLICNANSPITFLPMHKISQDHIELLFAGIRSHGGSNDNPTPRLFEAIYKKILVHTELMETSMGNCIPLEKISILNCSSAIAKINMTTPNQAENNSDDFVSESQEDIEKALESVELSQFSEHVIEYVAGYVSSALIKKIRCNTCIKALVSLNENKKSLIFYKDNGGLIYPSQMVIKICRRCESVIRNDFINSDFKGKVTAERLTHKALSSFTEEQLFPEYTYHQFYAEETNHIIELTKSVMKKYIDTRMTFIFKNQKLEGKRAVMRIYTKLIHFKNQ